MSQKINQTGVSLAPVIAECERILREAIAHYGLQTKPESIVVTIQSKGRRNALGWFWEGRWKQGKTALNEINMSAEEIMNCHPGELLIHELAHAENTTLGIRDCSGRRHNKKFKIMAEKLGLVCEDKPAKSVGFGYTKLGQGANDFLAKAKYEPSIFSMNRFAEGKVVKQGTRLLKVVCPDCDYTVRVTQKWVDVGLPKCPCGSHMEEAI